MKNHFWKNVLMSFSMFRYKDLTKGEGKDAFNYLITLFSIAFVVALIISIPGFLRIPKVMNDELSKITKFEIDVDMNTSETINFPSYNPYITVSNFDNSSGSALVITREDIIYRPILGLEMSYSTSEFKDIKENKDKFIGLVFQLLIIMAPSFILFAYIFNIVKYIIIAIVLSLIVKLFVAVFKEKVKYKNLFRAGLYSLTPLILIDMITIPLNLPVFYIPLILYAVWYIIISYELIEEF